jgi:hypothetical protein
MTNIRLGVAAAIVSLAFSCGSPGGNDGGGGGSGGSGGNTDAGASVGTGTCTVAMADAGTIGTADAGSACHQLPNCGEEVIFQSASDVGNEPTPTGGTIADGLYALTAVRTYNIGPQNGMTKVRSTLLKTGNTFYTVARSGASTTDGYGTLTATTSGADLVQNATCPVAGTRNRKFTVVSADQWIDYDVQNVGVSSTRTVAYEYTRVK